MAYKPSDVRGQRLARLCLAGVAALLMVGQFAFAQEAGHGVCSEGKLELVIKSPAHQHFGLVACSQVNVTLAPGAKANINTLLVDNAVFDVGAGSQLTAENLAADSAVVTVHDNAQVTIREGFVVDLKVSTELSAQADLAGVRSRRATLSSHNGALLKVGESREVLKVSKGPAVAP